MVTANHILGHFFAFVAMGISVFRSFVFCEKKRSIVTSAGLPTKMC